MTTKLQLHYDLDLELKDAREQFAQGLFTDIKAYGEAVYFVKNERRTLTALDVVEKCECELDEIKAALFMSPVNDVFTANKLREAIDEKAKEMIADIVLEAYP